MKTDQFELTVGVLPGYLAQNIMPGLSAQEAIAQAWQILMEREHTICGVFVSAIASPGVAIYSSSHGCPKTGETVVILRGVRNPEFNPDSGAWRATAVRISAALRNQFQQATAHLTFSEVDFYYLRG